MRSRFAELQVLVLEKQFVIQICSEKIKDKQMMEADALMCMNHSSSHSKEKKVDSVTLYIHNVTTTIYIGVNLIQI